LLAVPVCAISIVRFEFVEQQQEIKVNFAFKANRPGYVFKSTFMPCFLLAQHQQQQHQQQQQLTATSKQLKVFLFKVLTLSGNCN